MLDARVTDGRVLEGIELGGDVNTSDALIIEQVAHAIRQQHPQARPEAMKGDAVAIVGSGPSLDSTLYELRSLMFSGAKIVALNGALDWLVDHNIRPSASVVLDARASTARFVTTSVPGCLYYVASQCHPAVWETVRAYPRVAIWHATADEGPLPPLLDAYYGKGHWMPVAAGTTVASRALMLLRQSGYTRFHFFGVDSCWMRGRHHAVDQPENESDRCIAVDAAPSAGGESRRFECAPWHLKQLEDFLLMIRVHGNEFRLQFHGDGLLAHALRAGASVQVSQRAKE